MAEEIRTEIVADPTKHTAGVNQAKKDAQEFGKEWEKQAGKQEAANKRVGKSQEGLLREGMGLTRSLGELAKGTGDLSSNLGNVSFDLAQTGQKMQEMGGKAGQLGGSMAALATKIAGVGIAWQVGTKIGEVAGSFEVVRDAADSTAGGMVRLANWLTGGHIDALAEAVKGNSGMAASLEDWTTNLGKLDASLAAHAQTLAAVTGQTGGTELGGGSVPDRPSATPATKGRTADFAGSAEWAEANKQRTESAAQAGKARAARERAFAERERQQAMADADKLSAALLKTEEKAHADIAGLDKLAADNRALLRQQESAAQDRAADERMAKARARSEEVAAAEVAMIELHKQQIAEVGGDGIGLAAMLSGDETTEQFVKNFDAQRAALLAFTGAIQDAGRALLSANITVGMDRLIGSSVRYRHANKEAAKAAKASQLSTSESFKVATRDALKSVATRAAIEGAYKIASSIFPPNPAGLAAGAALLAVAALAGGAAAAIGPVTKTIPDSGKKSDSATATGGGVGRGATEGPASQTVNVTVYTLPGTEANGIYEGIERGMNRARRERGRRELPT